MPKNRNFEVLVKSKGLRITQERKSLFAGVRKQKGHFSIDGLVRRLKESGYKVSRDTVYRNIPLLLESGIIRRSFKINRDTMYEVENEGGHHDHMLCRICAKVIEFQSDTIENVQLEIAKRRHFQLEHHFHQLIGVCSSCQKSKQTKIS